MVCECNLNQIGRSRVLSTIVVLAILTAPVLGAVLYLRSDRERNVGHGAVSNADVALDGYCAVCKVEMGRDVKGKADFAVDYNGKRYLFPGKKQLDMFLAHPTKYVTE